MSFLSQVSSGVVKRPRRILIYGKHDTGKSTWATRFPKPLVIDIEGGTSDIDCVRVPRELLKTAVDVMEAVAEAVESDFGTVIIDSADWFERLVESDLHSEGFQMDYGKGAVEIARRYKKLLDLLDTATDAGKTVILIAHEEIRTAMDYHGNQWDQIRPKLTKRSTELTLEWVDEALYAKREDFVREEEGAFNKKHGIASTSGRRVIRTDSHPSYIAACRLSLPPQIDMNDPINPFLQQEQSSE